MDRKNKGRLWNLIIVLGCLVLLGTMYTAMTRFHSARAYEALARQREAQAAGTGPLPTTLPVTSAAPSTETKRNKPPDRPSPPADPFTAQNNTWLTINPDYSGWLDIPGTRIEYPFVRSRDNKDYLKQDFYGNYSDAGTLFLDYRNIGNFKDRHTIIYGHNMKNKTMFHDLVYFHDPAFFESHPIIELSGLFEEKTYRIFAVYEISATDYEFKIDFEDNLSFPSYLKELAGRSLHGPGALPRDKISGLLTLVTCSYGTDNGRTVIHAMEVP